MAEAPTTALPPGPLVVDSSCWLEVFASTPRAPLYQAAIAQPEKLLVPVIVLYEVFKTLRRQRGDAIASAALAYMEQGRVLVLDAQTSMAAAMNGLPFADSLIYASAQAYKATLWTQDAHFDGLAGVHYFPKS